nr:hypothetical protein [Sicyoidochytrium minutum DNA virus]
MESANPEPKTEETGVFYHAELELISLDNGYFKRTRYLSSNDAFKDEPSLHQHMGVKLCKLSPFSNYDQLPCAVQDEIWDIANPGREPKCCETCGKEESDSEEECDPTYEDLFKIWKPTTLDDIKELCDTATRDEHDFIIMYKVYKIDTKNGKVYRTFFEDGECFIRDEKSQ